MLMLEAKRYTPLPNNTRAAPLSTMIDVTPLVVLAGAPDSVTDSAVLAGMTSVAREFGGTVTLCSALLAVTAHELRIVPYSPSSLAEAAPSPAANGAENAMVCLPTPPGGRLMPPSPVTKSCPTPLSVPCAGLAAPVCHVLQVYGVSGGSPDGLV